MDISIINTRDNCKLKYDLYGNVYLKYNNELYNIIIESDILKLLKLKTNKLYDFNNVNIDHVYSDITSNIDPLKAKIIDSLEEENEDDIDYFPEDKFVNKSAITIESDFANEMDIDPMFIFYINNKFIENKKEYEQPFGFPFNSLYNFSIMKGTLESQDVMIVSEEYNNACSYNIIIYTCGLIKLNIIGKKINIYKIINNEEKLEIISN